MEPYESLILSIRERRAIVGIIGLGYVGLPLAQAFVSRGFRVLGFDCDQDKVALLNGGQSYIGQIAGSSIQSMRSNGFEASGQWRRLSEVDCIILCLPTPLTESLDPDLSAIVQSSQFIAETLRAGQLIVLESTTYPTTTRDIVLPIMTSRGLIPGRDFFLAYSPEREDPGNVTYSVLQIPKVVGGLDPMSLECAAELYEKIAPAVIRVSSLEVAEAAKILENTYRAVNIALVNELKMLYDRMGIDIWEVIAAASTKPFGFQAFYPGPGLGGHCIPIDPLYLSWIARKYNFRTRLIELAGDVNRAMPEYVVQKIGESLNSQSKPIRGSAVALLGMAYKKNVDDPRESPGFEIWHQLHQQGATVSYHDPHIPVLPKMRQYHFGRHHSQTLTTEYLKQQDCVVIITDHVAVDYRFVVDHSQLVIDTRNVTQTISGKCPNVFKA